MQAREDVSKVALSSYLAIRVACIILLCLLEIVAYNSVDVKGSLLVFVVLFVLCLVVLNVL